MTRTVLVAGVLALFSVGCALSVWALQRQNDRALHAQERGDVARIEAVAAQAKAQRTRASVASCYRVNVLRQQFNERGKAVNDWAHAEIALQESVLTDRDAGTVEKVSARLRIVELSKLAEAFGRVPLLNCVQVVEGG